MAFWWPIVVYMFSHLLCPLLIAQQLYQMGAGVTESWWATWADGEILRRSVTCTAVVPVKSLPEGLPCVTAAKSKDTALNVGRTNREKADLPAQSPFFTETVSMAPLVWTLGSSTCHLQFSNGHFPVYVELKFTVSICFFPMVLSIFHVYLPICIYYLKRWLFKSLWPFLSVGICFMVEL